MIINLQVGISSQKALTRVKTTEIEPAPSSTSKPSILSTEDVAPALEELFEEDYVRRWTMDAWATLISVGFAGYSNELERCQSVINFVALTEFYKDWLTISVGGERVSDYGDVLNALNLSAFRLGQLVAQHATLLENSPGSIDTDDELFTYALFRLESAARPKILVALKKHYGGLSGLFVALWNSTRQPRLADYREFQEEYDHARDRVVGESHIWHPLYQETDDAILNDATDEKMRLWEWLDQGAEPLERS